MRHPDSSLAAFVEGTATARERATAEAHLASCATCRKEVARARKARTVLASLPEVEFPGIDVASVVQRATAARTGAKAAPTAARTRPIAEREVAPPAPFEESLARAQEAGADAARRRDAAASGGAETAGRSHPATTPASGPTAPLPQPAGPRLVPVSTRGAPTAGETEPLPSAEPGTVTELPKEGGRERRKRERDRAWQLRMVQGALGAAAVLVAIVLFVGLRNPPGLDTARDQAAESAGSPSAPAPAFGRDTGQTLSRDSFMTYAMELAQEARQNDATAAFQEADKIKRLPAASDSDSLEDQGVACIKKESPVVVGSRLYAMSQGTYEGTPAYVGAFLIGLESDNPAILVIAASVDGCRLLELARVQL